MFPLLPNAEHTHTAQIPPARLSQQHNSATIQFENTQNPRMSHTEALHSLAPSLYSPVRTVILPLVTYLRTWACFTLAAILPRALPVLGTVLRYLDITLTINEIERKGTGKKGMGVVIETTSRIRNIRGMRRGTPDGVELALDNTTETTTTWTKLDDAGGWETVRMADALMFSDDGSISIGRYVDESTPSESQEAVEETGVSQDALSGTIEEDTAPKAGRFGLATTTIAQKCHDNCSKANSKLREDFGSSENIDNRIGKHATHYDTSLSASEYEDWKNDESMILDYSGPTNIFDERRYTAEDTWVSFRRFALDPKNATVIAARSGDSISSNGPFLPPGLSNIDISLTLKRVFSGTSIQPGSPAASSSRSRMSFAKFFREDDRANMGAQRDGTAIPHTPSGEASCGRRSRFASVSESVRPFLGKNTVIGSTSALRGNIGDSNTADLVSKTINCTAESGVAAGTSDVKTPTQLYRALSTLSFWTPAPKITVSIVPPVKRRRSRRRRENETLEREKGEGELKEKGGGKS